MRRAPGAQNLRKHSLSGPFGEPESECILKYCPRSLACFIYSQLCQRTESSKNSLPAEAKSPECFPDSNQETFHHLIPTPPNLLKFHRHPGPQILSELKHKAGPERPRAHNYNFQVFPPLLISFPSWEVCTTELGAGAEGVPCEGLQVLEA